MSDLDADLYLAVETRCGMYGHVFIRHDLLGLACMRCGGPHVCGECEGRGERLNGHACHACQGLGCRCQSGEDHDWTLARLAASPIPPPEGQR